MVAHGLGMGDGASRVALVQLLTISFARLNDGDMASGSLRLPLIVTLLRAVQHC